MKQICTKRTAAILLVASKTSKQCLLIALLSLPFLSSSQSGSNNNASKVIPELVFQNPVLVSGNDKQKGAIYRFKNVAKDIDALLEVKDISDNSTIINQIDLTNHGWNKAFQPEIGRDGDVRSNQNWWVRFRMSFVKSGTDDDITIKKFYVTALDVDGDNGSLQEYVQMQKADSTKLSSITNLSLMSPINCGLSNTLFDRLTQGPKRNFTNIDTSATLVMATYTYMNVNEFDFTIGAKTGNSATNAGLRLNSLWFKAFNLAPQQILPLKLLNFQGNSSNAKASLQWTVAENETGSAFELEKSLNGTDFNSAALIFTTTKTGVENYSFKEAIDGTTYYRLKMINKDNSLSYSKIIRLTSEENSKEAKISLLENPVKSTLQFSYNSLSGESSTITIFSMTGIKLFSTQMRLQKGVNSVQLNLNSKISSGSYLLEISNSNQRSISKFIKN